MDRKKPQPQEIYRHFKGGLYQIITIAKHSETGEELVVYQALYGNFGFCARPLAMFMSETDHDKYPDAKQRYRFEKVELSESDRSEEKTERDVKTEKATPAEVKKAEAAIAKPEDEERPNPDLIAFLDADSMAEKKRLLVAMKPRMTDRLVSDLAASLDVTVEEGDIEKRYNDLLYCVETKRKFEVERRG